LKLSAELPCIEARGRQRRLQNELFNGDTDADGYTNLEEYLNSLVP
jgi:hypothetical protein